MLLKHIYLYIIETNDIKVLRHSSYAIHLNFELNQLKLIKNFIFQPFLSKEATLKK